MSVADRRGWICWLAGVEDGGEEVGDSRDVDLGGGERERRVGRREGRRGVREASMSCENGVSSISCGLCAI